MSNIGVNLENTYVYHIQNKQEFYAICNMMKKFDYAKMLPQYRDKYNVGCFVVLSTDKKIYSIADSKPYEYYAKCKNLTDFHNKMVTQQKIHEFARETDMAMRDAQNAFNAVIIACDNSIKAIQEFTTLMYNISNDGLKECKNVDNLAEYKMPLGDSIGITKEMMDTMSRRHDNWTYTKINMSLSMPRFIIGTINSNKNIT